MHRNQISLFQKARELPNAKIRVATYAGESHLIHILSLFLAIAVCAYLYFVGVSIMNVISNREATAESERLQSVVGTLEQEYFTLSRAVTPDMAASLGLVKTSETSFVRRPGGVATNARPAGL